MPLRKHALWLAAMLMLLTCQQSYAQLLGNPGTLSSVLPTNGVGCTAQAGAGFPGCLPNSGVSTAQQLSALSPVAQQPVAALPLPILLSPPPPIRRSQPDDCAALADSQLPNLLGVLIAAGCIRAPPPPATSMKPPPPSLKPPPPAQLGPQTSKSPAALISPAAAPSGHTAFVAPAMSPAGQALPTESPASLVLL